MMNHRKILTILMAAMLCITLAVPAFAFNHYQLDVEAVKELTKTDTFDVQISKKTVTDGAGGGSLGSTPDMLTLTIDNQSPDTIKQAVIMLVFYDDEGLAQKPEGGLSSIVVGNEKRALTVMTFEDLSQEPGTSFQLNVPCSHSNFTGAQALVAQYINEKGEEITNPLAEEWQELALGSPTHILD